MELGSIATALAALRSSLDLVKAVVGANGDAKVTAATQTLNERVFEVQNAALQLQEKMSAGRDEIDALKNDKRELNAKIAELEKRKAEREQYKLSEISPGVFVLAHVEAGQSGTPMHHLCQGCMDNMSKKIVLQVHKAHGRVNLMCNECKAVYFTGQTYQINLNTHSYR